MEIHCQEKVRFSETGINPHPRHRRFVRGRRSLTEAALSVSEPRGDQRACQAAPATRFESAATESMIFI
jgi:hypothetical protein